ncbi:23S rRNA (adenine(2030)-N(6))-methyltransferase RlmJ [Verticiella sediminum]|uniref:Ribosomal RNA large subunit methyltransferase J n=1 Tax=Verticiella sediminum TaxID=1247510 RepID=A0A556AB13_9BURK|nr:23S rRNA (adenine(2030)-N(6))-methyltransferase RlmJ [Verticiella sediminum]TSH90085.1 23S rRNA (adenine(2030)-N(6))-methyltransferase RlmJ [Verticiella sediminum]
MFSYRHAFHAGNHADVLKHSILVQVLQYLRQKDKPFWYLDTHAGAGLYDLRGAWANKTGEYTSGIERLWQATKPPPLLGAYLEEVRRLNPDGKLAYYPGSPWIAFDLLGERDRLRLFEWHTSEVQVLIDNVRRRGREQERRAMIYATDGFQGLKALLPPPTRRGLVLIDPSYEDKKDYRQVMQTVKEGLERFATGTYLIWYPLIQRREAQQLPEKLARLPVKSWLNATLTVGTPELTGIGLHGSGVFVINPPYTLRGELATALPWLARELGVGAPGKYTLDSAG